MHIDTAVHRIYRHANCWPVCPPGIGPLASYLLGAGAVYLARGPSALLWERGWTIRVDAALAREDTTIALGRLVGYWASSVGLVPLEVAQSPRLPAALVLPTPAAQLLIGLAFAPSAIAHLVGLSHETVRTRLRDASSPLESGMYPALRTG